MSVQKPASLQVILKRRQQESFVGREEQITLFRRNLSLDLDDDLRCFIFNVFGQGGVGKTSLLRRFSQYAEEARAITAWTDENDEDVPDIMAHLAEQLERQDQTFKAFKERYHIYRQRRHELESDPEAPQNSPAFVGRILAKTGVHLGRRIPFAGAVLDCVDEDAFANQVSEWATYITRKITNKDEVQLVQEPIEVLSPLFLEGLRKAAEKHLIALFFDTYERSEEYLDLWLRNLLEGYHGDIAPNIVLTIAGRYELDRNRWATYKDLLSRLPLEPFSEYEGRSYLTKRGITDTRVVDVILYLSGRLPLLVATLAVESPNDPNQVGDPSGTAVDRFLKWVEDPKQRQTALDAALPRRFNRDILAKLVGENDCDILFTWLKQMPFVEKNFDGWTYHDVVRAQMLRYKHLETPQGWATLHHQLADHYKELKDNLALSEKQGQNDPVWQSFTLDELYHRLCYEPQKQLSVALNGFLAKFGTSRAFARRWAEALLQAGEDMANEEIQHWGKLLINSMKALDENDYESAIEMFTSLLNNSSIAERGHKIALLWRGRLYIWTNNYSQALRDLSEYIRLAPEVANARVDLGYTYFKLEHYKQATENFTRALELKPNNTRAIILQGRAYENMKQYEQALVNFTHAVELQPQSAHPLVHRGQVYIKLRRYEDARNDFDHAIEFEPDYSEAFVGLGRCYLSIKDLDKAITNCSRAIELNPKNANAYGNRGRAYKLQSRYEEALNDFKQAMELDKNVEHKALTDIGSILLETHQYQGAAEAFIKALVAVPACENCWTLLAKTYKVLYLDVDIPTHLLDTRLPNDSKTSVIHCRANAMNALGYHKEALAEFQRALALDKEAIGEIGVSLGLTFTYLGKYGDAIEIYRRVLKEKPGKYDLLYNIAVAMFREKGLIEAQEHIDTAHIALLAAMGTHQGAALYGLGGLEALTSNTDKALDYLEQAILIEEEAIDWGRTDVAWINLRSHPRFQALIPKF